MASNRRSMRNFLLDRKYQLRYTAIMVLLTALLMTGLGVIWYGQVREASKIIEVRALASMTEAEAQVLGDEMRRQDLHRLLSLVGVGALLVLVVTGYGIVLTHKVAGPMYKISLYMAKLREGDFSPIGGIRKGDHLHRFFASYQEMHEALCEGVRRDVERLEAALGELAPGPPYRSDEGREGAIAALRALTEQKKQSLGQAG